MATESSEKMRLHTTSLVKKYKKRTVVKGVSIEVQQGEIVGLLGPNGAGKTTTFYMIVGLIVPNEGAIYLNDKEITHEPVYRRAQQGIGYLAQEESVFRKLSVEDNIRSVLEMTNHPKEYQYEKTESLLNEFNLQKIRKNLGIQLSGGEKRRTEIARALALDPKFILLDEPFAGVDPIAVEDIVTEHKRAGTTRDEVLPIVEGPCKSVRLWLNHVLQRDAKLASVTQQTLEVRCVLRSRNNEDVAYARQHQCAQGVVHHGLIIHRQELFARHGRQRIEACATSSREDDSPHCSPLQSKEAPSSANTGGQLSDKAMPHPSSISSPAP